jgi:RimJ/RimL family protein N-acetyltransferase
MTPEDLDFIASIVCDPETMRFYPEALDRAGAEN